MSPPGSRPYADPDTGPILGLTRGGADSSNRPWETDTLRVSPAAAALPIGLAWLGVLAAALLALADGALMYAPTGAYGSEQLDYLAAVPRSRLLFGHYLGILGLPLYLPGYWLVYRALAPAGRWRSLPVLALASWTVVAGAALHASIGLLAVQVHARGGGDGATLGALFEASRAFTGPLQGVVFTLFAATSLWFAAAVAGGRTRLPRWAALANPLALFLVFALPYGLAPTFAPARLALPASFSLAHLVFFALLVAWLRPSEPAGA